MSAKEQIGRLQQLLERVQMRAQEPRTNGGAAHAPAPAMQAAPQVSAPPAYSPPAYSPPPPPVTRTAPPPVAAYPTPPPPAAAYPPTSPPPPGNAHPTSPPPQTEAYAASYEDGDMEVSSETVEVDIDIDEPMPMESGAQPVAQQTMPPDDLEDEVEEQPMATQPSVRPPPHLDDEVTQMAAPPPANEIEEPAPSSSRRPIAAEEVAETYGEESAPRHTPPPESGKQVAAPSVHPSSVRPSAPPPPSLGGHTLQGGWREPGLGVPEISPTAGGVRLPTPPPAAAAQASGTRLSPDVTRPDLSAGGAVATFEGAPIAKPTTMGELLDLTLSL